MPPLKKQFVIQNVMESIMHLFGSRVLSDSRLCLLSYLGLLMIIYYFFFAFYTIYYYIGRNELMIGLKCLCGIGMVSSVIISII